MSPEEILAFLRRNRVPHEKIAAAIGRDRSAATKMLNGVRSIKATEVAPLMALVGEYLQSDEFAERGRAVAAEAKRLMDSGEIDRLRQQALLRGMTPGQLPIRDAVQAGAWLEVDALDQREPAFYPASQDPRFPKARQWLSPVRGDSMNALTRNGQPAGILDGDLVHIVDAIDIDYRPSTGDVVEVERIRFDGAERELTLKQVAIADNGEVLLCPRSTNPRFQEPIPYRDGLAPGEQVEVRIRGKMLQVLRPFF